MGGSRGRILRHYEKCDILPPRASRHEKVSSVSKSWQIKDPEGKRRAVDARNCGDECRQF